MLILKIIELNVWYGVFYLNLWARLPLKYSNLLRWLKGNNHKLLSRRELWIALEKTQSESMSPTAWRLKVSASLFQAARTHILCMLFQVLDYGLFRCLNMTCEGRHTVSSIQRPSLSLSISTPHLLSSLFSDVWRLFVSSHHLSVSFHPTTCPSSLD